MNNRGKSFTFLLIGSAVVFLCTALIVIYLLKQETDKRVTAENSLSAVTLAKQSLEKQLSDSKKQLFLVEEKLKESDGKIKNLTGELETTKQQQEGIVSENSRMKEALAKEQTEKANLTTQFNQLQTELNTIKGKLADLKKEKVELEKKSGAAGEVPLGKIVVNPNSPGEIPPGSILTINKDYQFAVTNLGQDAVTAEQILTVTRDNQPIGELKVQRVQGNLSVADVVPPLKVEDLKEGDRVTIKK